MERFREIEAAFDAQGIDGAARMIASHGPAIRGWETLYALRGRDGSVLAGDADLGRVPMGLSTLEAAEAYPTNFRLYRQRLGEGDLITGVSYDDTDRLRGIALISFGWATAIVFAVGLGGGTVLAFRTRGRIVDLSGVMRQIGSGELTRRLPISSRMDDIDAFAIEVNVALDHLEATVAAMKQVTTDVAHDLKTPIVRLLLTLEEAYEQDSVSASKSLVFDAIKEIDKITSTFDALLRISQLEAGARRNRFTLVVVGQILEDVAEVYADIISEKSSHLHFAENFSSRKYTIINGDADLLKQMFANLVLNAIRHTPAGSDIFIQMSVDIEYVTVIISDNGPGIPPFERANVFKRFYRLDKSRTTEGSGLGLSLAKAIADLHGASISLSDNRPGLNVTVRFQRVTVEAELLASGQDASR